LILGLQSTGRQASAPSSWRMRANMRRPDFIAVVKGENHVRPTYAVQHLWKPPDSRLIDHPIRRKGSQDAVGFGRWPVARRATAKNLAEFLDLLPVFKPVGQHPQREGLGPCDSLVAGLPISSFTPGRSGDFSNPTARRLHARLQAFMAHSLPSVRIHSNHSLNLTVAISTSHFHLTTRPGPVLLSHSAEASMCRRRDARPTRRARGLFEERLLDRYGS